MTTVGGMIGMRVGNIDDPDLVLILQRINNTGPTDIAPRTMIARKSLDITENIPVPKTPNGVDDQDPEAQDIEVEAVMGVEEDLAVDTTGPAPARERNLEAAIKLRPRIRTQAHKSRPALSCFHSCHHHHNNDIPLNYYC